MCKLGRLIACHRCMEFKIMCGSISCSSRTCYYFQFPNPWVHPKLPYDPRWDNFCFSRKPTLSYCLCLCSRTARGLSGSPMQLVSQYQGMVQTISSVYRSFRPQHSEASGAATSIMHAQYSVHFCRITTRNIHLLVNAY